MGRFGPTVAAVALAAALAGVQGWAAAQAEPSSEADAAAEESATPEMPEFTDEVLEDPEMIVLGEEVWQSQCRSCHGRAAYPGKAPRLRPARYTPDFVYHRVTYGFRGMPGWEEVFSQEERVAVTAYILSRQFSP